MKVFYGLEDIDRAFKNSVVTVGNFDGLHLGHQKILQELGATSQKLRGDSVVLTFDPHPLRLVKPHEQLTLICPLPDRIELIAQQGIGFLVVINFSPEFSRLSPEDFIKKILVERLGTRVLVIGRDFLFGSDRSGNLSTLRKLAQVYNFSLRLVEPVKFGELVVGSSKIRSYLREGRMDMVGQLLGRPYRIKGRVVEGKGRGRELGYPTANLDLAVEARQAVPLLPLPWGVYAAHTCWGGKRYPSVINIGSNPTFGEVSFSPAPGAPRKGGPGVEVHILNFSRSLLGEVLVVEIGKRIRGERRFFNTQELARQIARDVEQVQKILA